MGLRALPKKKQKKTSVDNAVAAVLSEVDGIFFSYKPREKMKKKCRERLRALLLLKRLVWILQ